MCDKASFRKQPADADTPKTAEEIYREAERRRQGRKEMEFIEEYMR